MEEKTYTGLLVSEDMINDQLNSKYQFIKDRSYWRDEEEPLPHKLSVLSKVMEISERKKEIAELSQFFTSKIRATEDQAESGTCFIKGVMGSGKTITALMVANDIEQIFKKRGREVESIYIYSGKKTSMYNFLCEFLYALGHHRLYGGSVGIGKLQNLIIQNMAEKNKDIFVIIDEYDKIGNDISDLLLFLLKQLPNKTRSRISYLFITNKVEFFEKIDPRAANLTFNKTEISFQAYKVEQVQNILKKRIEPSCDLTRIDIAGVVEAIAALTHREQSGNIRYAITLFKNLEQIAEKKQIKASVNLVEEAKAMTENETLLGELKRLEPKQLSIVLYCIWLTLRITQAYKTYTGDVYRTYLEYTKQSVENPVTQRRVSDIIRELDTYGFVNVREISKGRFGRTKEISWQAPSNIDEDFVEILVNKGIIDEKPNIKFTKSLQTRL